MAPAPRSRAIRSRHGAAARRSDCRAGLARELAAIANTDYEGEIKQQGDKVKIRTKPTITIRDYTVDQNLLIERPSGSTVEFTIDRAKTMR